MPVTLQGLLRPDTLLRAALWLILLAVVASTKTDPDLWGHVRFGMDMIRDGTIRPADAYSFTSDREWVNHEWAAEILSGAAYIAGGNAGLIALKLAIVLGMLLLLNAALRREGVAEPRHRDLLIALAVITTIEQAHNVRPQLFSLLFFAALLGVLPAAERDRRYLAALPPLFALWVNFHGGWIVGGGMLVLWTTGLALSGRYVAAAGYAAAGAASLAATLLNPHGLRMLEFLRGTVGFGRADIVDWQPVYALGPSIWMLWALTAALAAFGLARGWKTGVPLERRLIIVALAVGSFRVNRLLAFFALATLFLLGATIAGALRTRARTAGARPGRAAALVAATVAVMLCAGGLRVLAVNAACVRIDGRTTPGAGAVEFFKQRGSSGRLLVWFDWGQYALWHLAPGLRVSVDGRRETVYSAAVQDRHLRFFFDAPGGATLPAELAADYIWIPKDLPAASRLRADGWTPLYTDARSVIFSRAPASLPSSPPPFARDPRRCFPDP
jgi:hypothetical protein